MGDFPARYQATIHITIEIEFFFFFCNLNFLRKVLKPMTRSQTAGTSTATGDHGRHCKSKLLDACCFYKILDPSKKLKRVMVISFDFLPQLD